MNDIVIENDVPPPLVGSRGRGARYPFGDMAIGESFTVEPLKFRSAQSACHAYAAYHGLKFTTRSRDFRIWRTA
jgi:hypothetical protein